MRPASGGFRVGLRLRCDLEGLFATPNTVILILAGTPTFLPVIEELLTARYDTINVPKWHRLSLNLRKMSGSTENRRLPASNSASKQLHMRHYANQTRTKCLHSCHERVAITKTIYEPSDFVAYVNRVHLMRPTLNFFGVPSPLDLVITQSKTGGEDRVREILAQEARRLT